MFLFTIKYADIWFSKYQFRYLFNIGSFSRYQYRCCIVLLVKVISTIHSLRISIKTHIIFQDFWFTKYFLFQWHYLIFSTLQFENLNQTPIIFQDFWFTKYFPFQWHFLIFSTIHSLRISIKTPIIFQDFWFTKYFLFQWHFLIFSTIHSLRISIKTPIIFQDYWFTKYFLFQWHFDI